MTVAAGGMTVARGPLRSRPKRAKKPPASMLSTCALCQQDTRACIREDHVLDLAVEPLLLWKQRLIVAAEIPLDPVAGRAGRLACWLLVLLW